MNIFKLNYRICLRRLNNQKAKLNSQGLPTYSNSVKGTDPQYQVRVFNGKPQFRIRKRNDSAKNPLNKNSLIKKAKGGHK